MLPVTPQENNKKIEAKGRRGMSPRFIVGGGRLEHPTFTAIGNARPLVLTPAIVSLLADYIYLHSFSTQSFCRGSEIRTHERLSPKQVHIAICGTPRKIKNPLFWNGLHQSMKANTKHNNPVQRFLVAVVSGVDVE